jgi:acyl carrier protein
MIMMSDAKELPEEEILALLHSVRNEESLSTSQDLVADGLLDSFDIVLLVTEIERRYGVEIPGDAIVPENFANLGTIRRLIAARMVDRT